MLKAFRQIFQLTGNYFIYSLIIASVLFVAEFSPVIFRVLNSGSEGGENITQQTVSQHLSSFFSQLSDIPHAQDAIGALLWGLAGLGLYLLYLAIGNIIIVARNEIAMELQQSRTTIRRAELWKRAGGKILAVVLFVLFFVVSVRFLASYWFDLVRIFTYSGMVLDKALYGLAGFVGFTLNLYFLAASAFIIWRYEETL